MAIEPSAPRSHANAARLKVALLLALALGIAGSAYALVVLGMQAYEPMQAQAQRQAQPETSSINLWIDMLIWLVLIAALGKLLLILWRADWGKDWVWAEGQWRAADPMALRPGSGPPLAEPLREGPGYKIGLSVMALIAGFALLGAGGAMELPQDGAAPSPLGLLLLSAAIVFASVIAYAGVALVTRRVCLDELGLCDANFFRSRCVLWRQIDRIAQVDDSSRRDPRFRRSDTDEASSPAMALRDAQGRELMKLPQSMLPPESLLALRQQFAARREMGASMAQKTDTGQDFESMEPVEPEQPQVLSALHLAQHQAMTRDRDRSFTLGVVVSASLILLLLGLPFAFTSYQALWFRFAAAQVDGHVVQINMTGRQKSLPSLVIEYRAADAKPMRIETDGTAANASYKVGDRLRVFYDPARPENARLDLFLELWLGPVVLGALLAIVGLIAALIARGLKPLRGA